MGVLMGERLVLARHETAAAVRAAYRAERDGVLRSHLQVIWLLLSDEGAARVAHVSGFTPRWVRELIRRWNEGGIAGLGDRRRGNAGAESLLDDTGLAALSAALDGAAEDDGLWNGRKVAAWMSAYLGRPVSPKRGLDYLHRLEFSLQRPRPRHARSASAEERAAFKKNSAARWRGPRPRTPGARSRYGPSTSIGSG